VKDDFQQKRLAVEFLTPLQKVQTASVIVITVAKSRGIFDPTNPAKTHFVPIEEGLPRFEPFDS
jgi:hypothetical protein